MIINANYSSQIPGRGTSLFSAEAERKQDVVLAGVQTLVPVLADLLAPNVEQQKERGYYHTLREICQQPQTWRETANFLSSMAEEVRNFLSRTGISQPGGSILLTGSGSSEYVGECLKPSLQEALQGPVQVVPCGSILTHPAQSIPPHAPCLFVSFARSGDSPESYGSIEIILKKEAGYCPMIITCNPRGRIVEAFGNAPRVLTIVLDERTCDRSLVMTSSFTNMVLAGRFLAMASAPEEFVRKVHALAESAQVLLTGYAEGLATLAREKFDSVVYLGSGARFGGARESALKMLEMTAGHITTFAETFLGVRHGPMSAIHPETLLVCFLASDPLVRAYEMDLIQELNRKNLGMKKVVVGEGIPAQALNGKDLAIECPGLGEIGDDNVPVLDVMIGQLLALFRCLHMGFQPDAPSSEGVISRVVGSFPIYQTD
jgi:tagatose-6-phosphate ketose/aldose isomerase